MNLIELLKSNPIDVEDNGYGGLHIPIDKLEDKLDDFQYSTRNFKWQVLNGETVAASIELELIVPLFVDSGLGPEPFGEPIRRTFVGTCNFSLASLLPIEDWLSTAKSMCVKNAASDAGRYLGRGLNVDSIPARPNGKAKRESIKRKPDALIMNKYINAVKVNDRETILDLLDNYDIKTELDY